MKFHTGTTLRKLNVVNKLKKFLKDNSEVRPQPKTKNGFLC